MTSGFTLGRHINTSKGFTTAPSYASSIGCGIFQIFLGVPMIVLSKARTKKELVTFSNELEKYNIHMVVHASYTINLCHPPSNPKYDASVKALKQDLAASKIIGDRCLGVIIHMGKNVAENGITNQEAINNYINSLNAVLETTDEETTIILETGASQGTEVGSCIDELGEIYWGVNENKRHRIKFCIDTCHIWATGYDISSEAKVKAFFKEFDDKIGIYNIACIHFNDSKTDIGSKVDRHADLSYGKIGAKGLKYFAIYSRKYDIPLITETPLNSVNPKTNKDVTFKEELVKIKYWLK